MKKLSLSTRVFIGFGLGILLGVIFGEKILVIKIIGDIFLKLIKMLTVPLVFFSIISGITNLTDVNKLKRVGAKTFIRVGSCGARRDGINIGEPVIVNAAVRAGGTGSAYLPDIYPAVASLDVVNAMIEASRELDLKAHVGVSLSRDAFYRQNPQLNETLRDVQAVAVSEMECDTVFVVGAALNVRTGAVVGTDSNIYLSVQPTQAEKEALYMKSEERTIAIALKACVLLAE